jgi:hypothetical protein
LQEQAPILVRYTKEAVQQLEANSATGTKNSKNFLIFIGYTTAQGRLVIILTNLKSEISSARFTPQDNMLNLLEAGGLVAKALAGLLTAADMYK